MWRLTCSKDFSQILTHSIVVILIIECLVCTFLLWICNRMYQTPYRISPLVWIFCVFLSILALIKNQENIDSLMRARRHPFSFLPPYIRYYNLALTICVIGIIFFLFLFRRPLTHALEQIGQGLLWIVSGIFHFLSWLSLCLLPKKKQYLIAEVLLLPCSGDGK